MRALVVGGASSGKSSFAQKLASSLSGNPVYFATMEPVDGEDRARIEKHLLAREGLSFETVECPRAVSRMAEKVLGRAVLFDSVTALASNEMFPLSGEPRGENEIFRDLAVLIEAASDIIFVSDNLFSDAVAYDGSVLGYQKKLSRIHGALAARCELVVELAAGLPVFHKGVFPL